MVGRWKRSIERGRGIIVFHAFEQRNQAIHRTISSDWMVCDDGFSGDWSTLGGGILSRESGVTRTLAAEIEALHPNAEIVLPELEPVYGALVIGLDSVGIDIDSDIIDNLKSGKTIVEKMDAASRR